MQFRSVYPSFLIVAVLAFVSIAVAQSDPRLAANQGNPGLRPKARATADPKLPAKKQFVLDVVKAAVALPQPDPQDRLRVLNSAASVVGPLNRAMAKNFAREGARLESELINIGQTPAVSMLASGEVDCPSAVTFVETIPPAAVLRAEQSLLGALTGCPKATLEPIRQKTEAALNQGTVAARTLLAVMERVGPKSRWSQATFTKMFSSLPDAAKSKGEAPNYAAMYASMAQQVDTDTARQAGLKFLEWLSGLGESGERNLAVNIATETLKQVLGPEKYNEALQSNIIAQQVAQTAGHKGEVEHPAEESVSVLQAMGETRQDRTEQIGKLPPSLRAREAAAHGFATGTGGDRKMADRYFDMAFSAVDEVWNDRDKIDNAPAVIEEVSEAAAQVDAVAALRRAQHLQDPSAQAIGMIAVARVALGQD